MEAAKATAISDFLQAMLESANPESAKGADYTVRQLLDDISAGLQNQLKDQPEVEASVLTTMGRAYQGLGEGAKAQAHLERALALRRRHLGDQHELVAYTLVNYAWSLFEQQQWAAAEEPARQALAIYRKLDAPPQKLLDVMTVLLRALCYQDRFDEAERLTREALDVAQRSPGQEFNEIPIILHGMAEAWERQGNYPKAESLALQAVEMHRRLRGERHVQVAWTLLCLGKALKGQNKLTEAERSLREALEIFRRSHSTIHKSVGFTITALRDVLEAKGDIVSVETLANEALSHLAKLIEENNADGELWCRRALLHADLKLWPEAAQDLNRAVELSKQANPTQLLVLGYEARHLSERAFSAGHLQVAERAALISINILKQLVQDDPGRAEFRENLGYSHGQLGVVLSAAGNHNHAHQAQKERLQIMEEAARDFPTNAAIFEAFVSSHFLYGQALIQVGAVEAAGEHLREAVNSQAALPKNAKFRQAESETRLFLGRNLERLGRLEEAIAEFRQACKGENANVAWAAAESRLRLASLLVELGRGGEAEILKTEVFPRGDAEVDNVLAWHLATWANLEQRDGRRAVAYAEQAVAMTNRKNYALLDTLAAAHARSGNFLEAIPIQQEAADLVINEAEKQGYLFRVSWYQGKEPYADHLILLERACGLRAAGKFAPAEQLARECVRVLEKELPGSWRLFDAQSTLVGSLVAQQEYKEAEPFLISCYEGLKGQTNLFPETHQRISKDLLQSMVQLYEATGRSDLLPEYRQRLTELAP